MSDPAARVIDANANRAREAARVVEEYFRFLDSDASAAEAAKTLRHGIQSALELLPPTLRARDNATDVGTKIRLESETSRSDLRQVVDASFSRLSEALRVLEEFSKTINPKAGAAFEGLRYQSYQLQSLVPHSLHLKNLRQSPVMAILGGESALPAQELVQRLADGGQKLFQIREKAANDGALHSAIEVWMQALSKVEECTVLINDRVDMALHFGADGAHLGQDDMPISAAKHLLGPTRIVTLSTHNLEEIEAGDAADGFGAGAIFPTSTKEVSSMGGIEWGVAATQASTKPLFCIGGISSANIESLANAGIRQVAVASALTSSTNPELELQSLVSALKGKEQPA